MINVNNRNLYIAAALLLLQLVGYRLLRSFPEYVTIYYSNMLYPYIGRAMRIGLGWIPFSFGDLVYSIGIIMLARWLWISRIDLITLSRKRYTQLLLSINTILLAFHILWGFNYYRQPLHDQLGIEHQYSTDQLTNTVNRYAQMANQLHQLLQKNDSLPVRFNHTQDQLFTVASSGFEQIQPISLRQELKPLSIKESLLTIPLTYMGYSGYLNPLTGEAQTNAWINCYKTPVLILHEMSHQLGYARENEANYIAIKAGLHHDDLYFKYSACIFGLRYLINDLYRHDQSAAMAVKSQLRYGILLNYKELQDFWTSYNGTIIEQVSHATYNNYLKANNQPDGLATYSYVVALLVNEYY